jgi:hypothetical protein
MKKKIYKIGVLAFATLFCLNVSLSQETELKKFTFGAGIAGDYAYGMLNLKFDYNLSNKWSVGIKNNTYFGGKADTSSYQDPVEGSVTSKYRTAIYNTSFLTGTYQFVGSNQNSTKFNAYVYAGIGLNFEQDVQEFSYNNPQPNSLLITKTINSDKYIIATAGLGANYKVGPGKIYLEIPFCSELWTSWNYKNEFNDGVVAKGDKTVRTIFQETKDKNYLVNFVGIQLGYQINF